MFFLMLWSLAILWAAISYNNRKGNEHLSQTIAQSQTTSPPSVVTTASSVPVTIGSTAIIPKWEWVEVVNTNPVKQFFSNGTFLLKKGETCGVEVGGLITVVKVLEDSNLLVKYTAPDAPMGTPCPSGVLYILNEKDFKEMNHIALK